MDRFPTKLGGSTTTSPGTDTSTPSQTTPNNGGLGELPLFYVAITGGVVGAILVLVVIFKRKK